MNKSTAIALLLSLLLPLSAAGWGQKGHDVTACIASKHLTPRTQNAVNTILEGESMVYWANWLDNASHTPPYAYSKTWHYRNVDAGDDYYSAPVNPSGDCVTAVKSRLEILNDPHSSKADKKLALIMLIHLVGDMHQPMHMGHATDLGGNRVDVTFFNRDTNLHSVWDTSLLESAHSWSYTEWADNIDRDHRLSPDDTAGTPDEWAVETLSVATRVYNETPHGSKLSYNEVAHWAPVIEQQLLLGGRRLAALLNATFDPAANP